MIYVIGSGPAGVSCAFALIERGHRVTLLDAGTELEEEKKKHLTDLKKEWDGGPFTELMHALDTKNPTKLAYGSDFPYRHANTHFNVQMDKHLNCQSSFAKGGLSNVWGAFTEEYEEHDFLEWPFRKEKLAPYYKKIFSLLAPARGLTDENIGSFSSNSHQLSAQAKALFANFSAYQGQLQTAGFRYAPSQLAVNFGTLKEPNCRYCGMCQHGCPIDLIYSANQTLQYLMTFPQFSYVNHVVVESIHESPAGIRLDILNTRDRQRTSLQGSQVFSACGPVISTYLALTSAPHHPLISFKDSSHFMLPCLMHQRIKQVSKEKLHTLCQLYLKIHHPEIAAQALHLQVYTYMDYYLDKFKQLFKSAYPLLQPLLPPFIDRMIVIQGYLHSAESHGFTMAVKDNNQIQLTSQLNNQVKIITQRLLRHLHNNRRYLGFTPIKSQLKISQIARSFHYGGSMPMKITPTITETDSWGRPFGHKRIHLVDASIFPSIPAGSITPTIMANAYRIGAECEIH